MAVLIYLHFNFQYCFNYFSAKKLININILLGTHFSFCLKLNMAQQSNGLYLEFQYLFIIDFGGLILIS